MITKFSRLPLNSFAIPGGRDPQSNLFIFYEFICLHEAPGTFIKYPITQPLLHQFLEVHGYNQQIYKRVIETSQN